MIRKYMFQTAVLLILAVSSEATFRNAKLVETQPSLRKILNLSNPCSVDGISTCTVDCRGLQTCQNGQLDTTIRYCPKGSYCNSTTNVCSATTSSCIVEDPNVRSCLAKFTADLKDCRKYYYCIGDGYIYQQFCSTGTVFDRTRYVCTTGIPCNSFSNTSICLGLKDKPVAVPGNSSLFVVCGDVLQLYKCQTDHTFSQTLQTCVFNCPSEGRFPINGDPLSYIECISTGIQIQPYVRKCEIGTEFLEDGILGVCVVPSGSG